VSHVIFWRVRQLELRQVAVEQTLQENFQQVLHSLPCCKFAPNAQLTVLNPKAHP
jgi:hypothetical protein